MKISEAFPGNFLKAEDLNGKPVTLTIDEVTLEELKGGGKTEKKLLLSFRKTDKKLICNKTNANTISKLYGDDTDGWVDQRITLVPREVEFAGDMVWAIRVSLQKPPTGPGAKAAQNKAVPPPPDPDEFIPEPPEGTDNEVPF